MSISQSSSRATLPHWERWEKGPAQAQDKAGKGSHATDGTGLVYSAITPRTKLYISPEVQLQRVNPNDPYGKKSTALPQGVLNIPSENDHRYKVKISPRLVEIIAPLTNSFSNDKSDLELDGDNYERLLWASYGVLDRTKLWSGDLFRDVDYSAAHQLNEKPKPKRQRIRKQSRKSRNRLMKTIGRASFTDQGGFHITLTYPKEFPTEQGIYKGHLDTFFKRARRMFKKWNVPLNIVNEMIYLWKLEFQKRGAPHYHILLFGFPLEYHALLRAWVSRNWYEVVGSGDEKHLLSGTEVSVMRNGAYVMAYVSKYVAKLDDGNDSYTGRFWGTSTNWDTETYVMYIAANEFNKFRRFLAGYLKSVGATFYAKRIVNLRSFFVAGVGHDTNLIMRGLANLHTM